MKFGQTITQKQTPEWIRHMVPYENLKLLAVFTYSNLRLFAKGLKAPSKGTLQCGTQKSR